MNELVPALLVWISLQLGVGPPAHPDIRFVADEELVQLLYEADAPADAVVLGVYDRRRRTIYLGSTWRADRVGDQSSLLHELVHHVQESSGLRYACLQAREGDAYHLQLKWLRQHGVADPYAFLSIDEFTIAVLSVCPSD